MNRNEAIEILKAHFGNHSKVAAALHVSVPHYRNIRNGRVKMTERFEELLILKASLLKNSSVRASKLSTPE